MKFAARVGILPQEWTHTSVYQSKLIYIRKDNIKKPL